MGRSLVKTYGSRLREIVHDYREAGRGNRSRSIPIPSLFPRAPVPIPAPYPIRGPGALPS